MNIGTKLNKKNNTTTNWHVAQSWLDTWTIFWN